MSVVAQAVIAYVLAPILFFGLIGGAIAIATHHGWIDLEERRRRRAARDAAATYQPAWLPPQPQPPQLCYGLDVPHAPGLHPDQCLACAMPRPVPR